MKWTIEEGNIKKQVQSVGDIVSAVKNVMDEKAEFLVLSPEEPVNNCFFMQAVRDGADAMYFEININRPNGDDSYTMYTKHPSPDIAMDVLAKFYLEGIIPDLNNWLLGSDIY